MKDKLNTALNEISDTHIAEAAGRRRRKTGAILLRIGSIAAAVAIVIGLFRLSRPISADAVSLASDSRLPERPKSSSYADSDDWWAALNSWADANTARSETVSTALSQLSGFFTQGSQEFLADDAENTVWSPINACIGLAMAAEVTDGESRQQILELLGADSTETLRTQISALWESTYKDNGSEICTLANSLWLEEGLSYQQETMDVLAYHYYASVYQGDLGSSRLNRDIGSWLSNNTGGMLKKSTKNVQLPEETVLALYSTLYFQSKWQDQFRDANNTTDVFHAPSGDKNVTYMNKKLAQMTYHYGDCFSAVAMGLKNGSTMWLILPDEGFSPADVLADGQYMEMILSDEWENHKYMKVNLSIPKFDVSDNTDLKSGLMNMGVTDIFSPLDANFSAITSESPVVLTSANQAVRVQVDEEGVKAAVYIEFPGAGAAMPPEEIIDFVLDRPFLFVITNDHIPLFSGVVNEP